MKRDKIATDGIDFSIRPATLNDLPAVFAMACQYDISVIGEPDVDESDFIDTWENPKTKMSQDVWVAVDSAGDLLAYEHCVDPAANGRLEIEGFVHPDHHGKGIGSALLRKALHHAEQMTARLPHDVRHFIRSGTFSKDEDARSLMESGGFTHARYFLRMTARLESSPSPAEVPKGLSIRPALPDERLEPIHAACDEIFRDHWGNTSIAFDEWVALRTGGARHDRSLWFLAVAPDGQIAGISLCSNYPDTGWVETLGVRRTYRGRGLGKALLQHSFVALHAKGQRKIGLGVDADSLTGATKLYRSAGMEADVTVDVWERELG